MKTEHTPGPWHVEQSGSIYAKNEYIGIALDGRPWGKKLPQEANARLMAAAPELFEFVEKLSTYNVPVGFSAFQITPVVLEIIVDNAKKLIEKIEEDE